MDENQICEDYRRSGDVKIVAQLNDIPRKQAIEILRRHRYIAQPPSPRDQYKTKKAESAARAKLRAAREAEQDQIIKVMVESGCSYSQIGAVVNLSSQAVYYRKLRMFDPEKYAEHKRKTYEKQKKTAS